jgi:hypothetical protein
MERGNGEPSKKIPECVRGLVKVRRVKGRS